MDSAEIHELLKQLANPSDPYRPDLKVIRKGLIFLLEQELKRNPDCETEESKPKRGRPSKQDSF